MPKRKLIYDIETNGFLRSMDRIHVIVALDVDTGEMWSWNRNEEIDNIADGVRFLQDEGALLIGHNVIAFDAPAIKKIYPWFKCPPQEDTLVSSRTMYSDIRNSDYARLKTGKFPNEFVGKHSLESWGYRLGLLKGTYDNEMRKQGLDPWATWNQSMHDYCVLDVQVTHVLWEQMKSVKDGASNGMVLGSAAEELEIKIHSIMTECEADGFPFDKAAALTLAEHFSKEKDILDKECRDEFGMWFAPVKKYIIGPRWENPKDAKDTAYAPLNPDLGITVDRTVWGEPTLPKVSNVRRGITKGVPYTKIKLVEFNPNSRTQIIDRLNTNYGWTPADFTDKGTPEVNDDVLEALAPNIPIAGKLANLMYYGKRLGQISEGAQAWLRVVQDDGRIHGHTNTGGAVTGRCTHSSPNMSQVPGVVVDNKVVLKGLPGKHGFECRSLFYVPLIINGEEWVQLGADLKGLEFCTLAEATQPFDSGELIDFIRTNKSIHDVNMKILDIAVKFTVKRIFFGLTYGAGDNRLGEIAEPLAPAWKQKTIGRNIRAKLMKGLPALAASIEATQKEAAKGYITAVDGRQLSVRSQHSAFNTKLQGNGAIIAKRWVVKTREYAEANGLKRGWDGDFVLLGFFHDEQQYAVKKKHAELLQRLIHEAAEDAGTSLKMVCPIAADTKIGHNWAECH